MKIRTRLLLFLLPPLIGSITLVSSLLAYNWYEEVTEGFRARLRSAALSAATFLASESLEELSEPTRKSLHQFQKEWGITRLTAIPASSFNLPDHPHEIQTTPLYSSPDSPEKKMTGYAPIYTLEGTFLGVIAAEVDADRINQQFYESLSLIGLCAGFTVVLLVSALFFIAHKISKPVQKLNNSALAIAAGQYGQSIEVQGPKEIAELAHTLNTMSECLLEQINRLKENALVREKVYGEHECSRLFQHMMLQKNIDECSSDAVAVQSLTFFSSQPKGLLLDFPEKPDSTFSLHLVEAEEEGFEGMYQLLSRYKRAEKGSIQTDLSFEATDSRLLYEGSQIPFYWSLEKQSFLLPENQTFLTETGDFFFLFNEGMTQFFGEDRKKFESFLGRVLRNFSFDGLEACCAIFRKELQFAIKRKGCEQDLHLLCFQLLK